MESDVGERESAWIGIVAAADIAMDTGEPDLDKGLAGTRARRSKRGVGTGAAARRWRVRGPR